MGETVRRNITGAALASTQTLSQLVVDQLLAGLEVVVKIDGTTYGGYVHSLDIAPGPDADFLFADVNIPELNQGDDVFDSVRVSIHRDGTVNVMPDEPQDE